MPLARLAFASEPPAIRIPRVVLGRALHIACQNSRKRAELTVIFVTDRSIAKLHRDFLSDPRPTDVLTFVTREDRTVVEADIYVSVDTAARQARVARVSRTNELVRLAVHGALHCLGFDDRTARARARMWRRQERILVAAATPGNPVRRVFGT